MTDKKITQLTQTFDLQNSALIPVVVDVATAPVTKAVSMLNLQTFITEPKRNLLTNGNFVVSQRFPLGTYKL